MTAEPLDAENHTRRQAQLQDQCFRSGELNTHMNKAQIIIDTPNVVYYVSSLGNTEAQLFFKSLILEHDALPRKLDLRSRRSNFLAEIRRN